MTQDLSKVDAFLKDYREVLRTDMDKLEKERYLYKLWRKDAYKIMKFLTDTVKDISAIKKVADDIKNKKYTHVPEKERLLLLLYEERIENFLKRARCRMKNVADYGKKVGSLYDILTKEEEEMKYYRDILRDYKPKTITKAVRELKRKDDRVWEEIPAKEREEMVKKYLSSHSH